MKKWTKVLSAFVVATVMSTGISAIAGCSGCGDDEHQHAYKAEWSKDKDGHWKESDCGHEPSDKEVHIDEYVNGTETKTPDGKCDVCEWAMSVPVVKVTVTFNSDGGSAVEAQEIDKGGKATKPNNPTKEDHTFAGWFLDGATTAFDFNTVINESITLTAHWKPDGETPPTPEGKVTVTFVTPDGATAVGAQEIDKGGKATRPETDPTMPDHTFVGWFTEEGGATEFDFDAVINTNVSVYAKFTPNEVPPQPVEKVTVTFVTGEGATTVEPQEIDKGSSALIPETPKKTGFVFGGWYVDNETFSQPFDFGAAVNEIITLYAKWKTPETVYEILSTREDNIIAEDFSNVTTENVPVHGGVYGNAGVYVAGEKSALTEGSYKVENGALTVGGAVKGTQNVLAVTDFGVVSSVEGYFEFTMSKSAKKDGFYNSINFKNQNKTVLQIMAVGEGNFRFILNGTIGTGGLSAGATELTPAAAVASSAGTLYKIEFKLDENKKFTLKINGTAVLTEADGIESLTGFTALTSNGGERNNVVDNIAVCGTAVSLDGYKTELGEKLSAKLSEMTDTENGTHKTNADSVKKAYDAGKTVLDATDDFVSAYTVYNEAVTAMNTVASDVQQSAIDYVNGQFPSANYTQSVEEYAEQIAKILNEKDASKLVLPDDTAEPTVTAGATLKAVLDAFTAVDENGEGKEHILSDKEICYNYFASEGGNILKEFPPENYQIFKTYYDEAMKVEFDYDSYDSYEKAKEAAGAIVANVKSALSDLATDAEIILRETKKEIEKQDIANYRNDDIAALEQALQDVINAEKTNAVNTVADGITDLDGFADDTSENFFLTVITARVNAVKASIDSKIATAGKTVEEMKVIIKEDYKKFIEANHAFIDVTEKDGAFAAELKTETLAAYDTAVQGITEEDGVDDVYNAQKALQDGFAEWLAGELDKKTYTITLNGTLLDVTVKYGASVAVEKLSDPTDGNHALMIDPDDGNYYADENFTVKYEGEEVYANAVLFVRTVEAVMVEAKTNNFSYGAIPKKADNAVLVQADFEGTVNSFLKIQGTDLVTYRTSNNCIQNKDDGLKVYFAAGGSLSVKFASTGGSNKSRLGLKDEKGNWIAGVTSATEVKDGIEDGTYEMAGTTVVEIVFQVMKEGWYTISCPSSVTTRGARITVINQTVNAYKVKAIPVTGVEISKDGEAVTEANIYVNSTVQLDTVAEPVEANNVKSVVWSTSNDETATVDQSGLVTGKAAGTAEITVTVTDNSGKVYTKSVNVTVIAVPVESVSIERADGVEIGAAPIEIPAGTALEFVHVINPSDATDVYNVEWSSSNDTVATVKDGIVTAIGAGEAIITVTVYNNNLEEFTATVTVAVPDKQATAIHFEKDEYNIVIGDDGVMLEVLFDEGATAHGTITWSYAFSDNDSTIASVEDDDTVCMIEGLKAGTVTVTATLAAEAGDVSATCTVTISEPPSTVEDAIDISGDTNTSGHAFNFVSGAGYFTVKNSGNYKYSTVFAGGALIGTSAGRGLIITVGDNVESITITLKLGISGDSKYTTKTSTATVSGAVTGTITHDTPSEICEYTVTLTAGQTITITGTSNLALAGATAVVSPLA